MLRCGGGMITQHASNSTCFTFEELNLSFLILFSHGRMQLLFGVLCVIRWTCKRLHGNCANACIWLLLLFYYFTREIWSNSQVARNLFSFELHYKFIIKKACKSTSHAKLELCLLDSALCELLQRCSKNWKIEGFSRKIKAYGWWRELTNCFPWLFFAFFFVNVM